MGLIIRVKGIKFTNWVGSVGDGSVVSEFLNATGLDISYQSRLETLVDALQNAGLWDKISALYPFLGSTFEQMSYNLKDTSFAKLKLHNAPTIQTVKDVGWKRTAGGYISVDGGFPATQLNDYHLLACTDELMSGDLKVPIGVGANKNGSCVILYWENSIAFRSTLTNGIVTTGALPSKGLVLASHSGIVVNGSSLATTTLGSNFANTLNMNPLVLGGYTAAAINNPSNVAPETKTLLTCQYNIAGFGKQLTTAEMVLYSDILNQFKFLF